MKALSIGSFDSFWKVGISSRRYCCLVFAGLECGGKSLPDFQSKVFNRGPVFLIDYQ